MGHYEGGDTLVVDTVAQNARTQIDRFGTTHSAQLHVVERYRIAPIVPSVLSRGRAVLYGRHQT